MARSAAYFPEAAPFTEQHFSGFDMQAPPIVGPIWDHLQSSGLVAAPQLKALQREFASAASDADVARRLIARKVITQFQADRLLEGRARGFFFDRYKILDLIGLGGMGWVYQAENTATGESVALKVLLDQLQNDSGMVARFQQEARVGLRLDHPNVVRTHRLGSAGGQPYMVMDFIHGLTLLELLARRRQLPWQQACDFARQAALGLDHAHHKGLVHRDVKPQNLLIDETGQARLLDFGLSMIREGDAGDEFSMAMIFGHQCVGTAEYMAPEQAADSLAVDGRADLYSLGGTLFAALTGELPFHARSASAMLKAHRTLQPRSVRELAPAVPEEVAAIVNRLLEKKPERRFATAAEVAAALAPWSQSAPVEFDFDHVLAERKRHAREKQALLPKSRPMPDIASETARPATVSSVAKCPPDATVKVKSTRAIETANTPVDATAQTQELSPKALEYREAANAAARQSHALLVSLNNGSAIPLAQERIVIGRGIDCDLQLVDQAVSTRHCELRFDGFQWWITDLASRNGTRVNGTTVIYQLLRPRDEILIGNQLRFRIEYEQQGDKGRSKSTFNTLIVIAAAAVIVAVALMLLAFWWLNW